jgi:sarcosine oxidase
MGEFVHRRIPWLDQRCMKAVSCLYTCTPDYSFVVDRHPEWDKCHIVSACSGHGFKHSAAIGEAVAERVVLGRSEIDLSSFSIDRLLD